jgi:hypothetical protein
MPVPTEIAGAPRCLRGWGPEFENGIRREAGGCGALAGGLPRRGGGTEPEAWAGRVRMKNAQGGGEDGPPAAGFSPEAEGEGITAHIAWQGKAAECCKLR